MKRPLSVTIISWFFIAAGAVGFFYHLPELDPRTPFTNDAVWVLLVRLLAIVGGILTLRGYNIGRWLLVVWLLYHVVLSFYHELSELIMHVVLTVVISYFLFRQRGGSFFR
jgi:hypothetical protein